MSHTSKIDNIRFVDESALAAAVSELRSAGARVELRTNVKPRAFYRDQQDMGVAPYVIYIEDGQYDVGLYRAQDGNGLEARCDLFGGYIARHLGAPRTGNETEGQAALGKLFRTYAAHAAMNAVQAAGHTYTRIDNEDGSIQLQVQLRAA